jgi:hypothetical protein
MKIVRVCVCVCACVYIYVCACVRVFVCSCVRDFASCTWPPVQGITGSDESRWAGRMSRG